MPNRLIREGWLESEPINSLDSASERFFLRVCLRADDFGRYHANPVLLKSSLFPLSESIRSTDIPRWLAACETAGLIRCYEVDGKRYLEIPKFGQRMRAAVSKFPHPTGSCLTNDGHMSDKRKSQVRPPRPESETESKSETDSARSDDLAGSRDLLSSSPNTITAEAIYEAYPRKDARKAAMKSIASVMKRKPAPYLLERTQAYAVAMRGVEIKFIPHASTWFNQDRYDEPESLWNPDGKKFVPPKPAAPTVPEPANWRERLRAHYPDSRIIREGDINRAWEQLSKHDQQAIIEALQRATVVDKNAQSENSK